MHIGTPEASRGIPSSRAIGQVLDGRIDPGKVFDLTLPREDVAQAYRAMDERRAIKAPLRP
jgi:threonine dehydrogenase-like Zn-dependent dehydrogenase